MYNTIFDYLLLYQILYDKSHAFSFREYYNAVIENITKF
jgi:hypothetical protein